MNDNVKARKDVEQVWDRIPEEFVRAYLPEIASWGENFQARGPNCTIILRRIPGMPVLLDGNGQVPQIPVHISAKVDRARAGDNFVRLVISPESSEDLWRIRRHLEDIRRFGPPEPPVGRPKDRPSIEVPLK